MCKIPSIYKIQSIIKPDRIYIGSAVNVKSRWCLHLSELRKNKHHSSKLQNHYNKYGKDDLKFIVVEPCLPEFLIIREQFYIDTLKPFFNICKVANSRIGLKASEETKQKMRKPHTPEHIENSRQARIGRKMSEEFCRKRSEYMKGNKLALGTHPIRSAETIKKLSGVNNHEYGKKYPYKPRKKKGSLQSENMPVYKGRYVKVVNPQKRGRKIGHKHTEEAILKMKESKRQMSAETRMRMSNSKVGNTYARKY